MSNDEPLSCPFCGCKPVAQTIFDGAEVRCTARRCPVNPRLTIWARSAALAVKKWNERLKKHARKEPA